VLRLGSGAVDLVTFWVPGFNGFPVSDSYDNCLVQSPAQPAAAIPAGYQEAQPLWEEPVPAPPVMTPPKEEKPRYTK
jgi:hypothetical protein